MKRLWQAAGRPPAGEMGLLERAFVRLATLASVAAAVALPVAMQAGKSLPSIALGSDVLLWLEQSVLVLVGLLILTAVVYRGIIRGQAPSEISKDGVKWEEVVGATLEALDGLNERLDQVEASVDGVQATLVRLGERGVT